MAPAMRCFASPTVALLETVPHLLTVMTPNIRAVGGALISIRKLDICEKIAISPNTSCLLEIRFLLFQAFVQNN